MRQTVTGDRPSAMVAVRTQASERVRLRVLRYGEDDRIPNPGDLLILANMGDALSQLVELAVVIPGRDMQTMARAVNAAVLEYEANKAWLQAPVTTERAG